MSFNTLKKAGLTVALVVATTSTAYAYNAQKSCINKVTEYGSNAYHGASNVHVKDGGHHSYKVTGNIKSRRDGGTHHFSCDIRHKEIVNWKVNSSSGHKNNTAAVIGVGILALAVAGAIDHHNKKSKKKHKHDNYRDHNSGGNPFSDMHYIKRQCKKNIRQHIKRDYDGIYKIGFDSAHLKNRKLRGTGYVEFDRGGDRELSYECDFDRRGRIYDGYYRFRHRR